MSAAPSAVILAADWRAANAEWLCASLRRLRLRLHRRALWLQRTQSEPRAVAWLLTEEDLLAEQRFFAENAGAVAIVRLTATMDAQLSDLETRMRDTLGPPALLALADLVHLSSFETGLLLLAAAPALDAAFGRAYCELHDDPRRHHATLHLALALADQTPPVRIMAADYLLPGGPLRSLRLIDVMDEPGEPLLTRHLTIDDRMTDYLRGINCTDMRLAGLLSAAPRGIRSPAAEEAAAEAVRLIAAENGRWTSINFLGAVAGGARDAADCACAELGLRLFLLDAARLAACSVAERATLIALIGREAVLAAVAVLVDASAIERGSAAAGAVDELIETLAATLFVVSPTRWNTGAAQIIHVAKPSRTQQCALWKNALGSHSRSVNGAVEAIVQQFDFGPPAIAESVARAVKRSSGELTAYELWRSCRDQSGAALSDLARRITPCYCWGDIVVSDDVRAQLRELSNQVEQRARVYESWGFGAQLGRGRGITALFAGPSGTGKTMAAEILAAHLDLELYRIDLAGIVSKYIGETEKNLRRVFDAAEQSGAILFFDEADALFGTRTEVRDSHDRYANLEINYLLQRMEDYAGLAILATNRRATLDPAFLRRLRFVIEFPVPAVDHRRRIWERVFPPPADRESIEYGFLSRLELTGGNIRSIAVNAAFLAAGERSPIGMSQIMRAAAREYTKLSKAISAAEFGPYYGAVRP